MEYKKEGLALLGLRRELGAIRRGWNTGMVARSLHTFDEKEQQIDAYNKDLKTPESSEGKTEFVYLKEFKLKGKEEA
jgi:hypothetical protein